MKLKNLFALATAIAIYGSAYASTDVVSTYSEETPSVTAFVSNDKLINVDGGKFSVGAVNNKSQMLLQVRINEAKLVRRVLMEGLNLYVDVTGKKKEKYRVEFPKVSPKMMPRERMARHQGEGNMPHGLHDRKPLDLSRIVDELAFEPISFFCGDDEYMLHENEANIEEKDGAILFTCILPYSKFSEKFNKKDIISVEIATRKMKMPTQSSDNNDGDEMGGPGMPPPPGGMGGPGGPGGMPPRMGGGMYRSFGSQISVYKKWVTISLSGLK